MFASLVVSTAHVVKLSAVRGRSLGGLSRGLSTARMAAAADTHVTIVPYFTVPDGKMDEFKAGFKGFYDGVATGTDETLYYGFATCGNKVFCREGYKSAAGALAHIADVDGPLNAALAIVGEGGLDLSVMGPAAELDQMREALTPLGCKFWETDGGNVWK